MVFHWRLSDSKSPQVSWTLLSILSVFNNDVWDVSTRLPKSKSSRPFNNHLVTVPKTPITIGIIVTFLFHSFFNSLARSTYLSLFSHSFNFILWSAGSAKSTIIIIIIIYSFSSSHQCFLIVSHWNLSDSKSLQVLRTLLSILPDLNTVIWMISSGLLISMSSCPCTNPLVTVSNVPITIRITVTFMFHSFKVL